MEKRCKFNLVHKQFVLIPTFGVTWHCSAFKFHVCAMWLFWGITIGCCKQKVDE